MLEKLHITEDVELKAWVLSYLKPEFQGGLSMTIDKQTAIQLLFIKNTLKHIIIEDVPHYAQKRLMDIINQA